jgi:trimeric autotransporter adhesin
VSNIRSRTDRLGVLIAASIGAILLAHAAIEAAGSFAGRVVFNALPVPGATVTITRGTTSRTTVTDEQGVFRVADLDDGPWTLKVEMLGFAVATEDVVVAADAPAPVVTLALLPFDEIASRGVIQQQSAVAAAPTAPQTATQPPRPATGGFQRAPVRTAPAPPSTGDATIAGDTSGDRAGDAADGFLINGSVNNSAASPFAQLPAFGNNRRGPRSLYNGGVSVQFGNSAWDARPFSFGDQPQPRPSYSDVQIGASFGGPMKIPRLRNKALVFLGFQHLDNHDATTQSALVPTDAERAGDFSQTVDALGRPIRLSNPATGLPFSGNVIPAGSITPPSASLLHFYPDPNIEAGGRYNYQTPVLVATHQNALQSRVIEALDNRNQLFGNVSWQRTATDAGNVFGFVDSTRVSGIDAPINWSHRFSQFVSLRLRYQYTELSTHVTPFFSNRENVSGEAGIGGNDQTPANWGPPALLFSSGIATLATAQYASNGSHTHAAGAETIWSHGRHNVTAGGDYRVHGVDVVAEQNARGTFTFNGASTGSDVADFLLGLPHTSAIAFGNADKNLRQSLADAYITDDWRFSPTLTANVGLRWEFESPFTERYGRLANLDVRPGFTSASPVTGATLRSDFAGVQPRLGVAWRPVAGSSLVVRGGYGIYRNTSVYQALTLLLAQQPPLSTTLSVENSAAHPLTLANGFVATPGATTNTFAVDPDLRVGYAHNWQLLVQRDLPGSTTITGTYLGTKGSHLLQEFLPNTYPIGVANPCPACPSGFVYLTSNGSSTRNAGQVQLRRRLRAGLTANIQYTLSKATDDAAAAYSGVSLNGASIAQDWLNLEAERAPSNFDQRHLVTAQVQYTTGMGIEGGALASGVRGSLLKGWTMTGQLTAGSGLPTTPIYLTSVPGTGVTGSIRADQVGASGASNGEYANPAVFSAPFGHWGTAGRNSIRGPAQFGLNASLGRSFLWGNRLTFDWRVDATNVLNRVTYTGINTIVGSPQFGLPIQANAMRKLQSSLRMRF